MKVYFIGAGPGAPDLITVRGAGLLAGAEVVLYSGSLVPAALLQYCRREATIVNTAGLTLDQQVEYYRQAAISGQDVARLHTGDPSIYGATAEQIKHLKELNIDFEIVPGVSSFSAAAAAVKAPLTVPEISQTIILTRAGGRATGLPDPEKLASLAQHRATMCIFLSGDHLSSVFAELLQHYAPSTPVALVQRASQPEERIHYSTLERIEGEIDGQQWCLTTMLLVGEFLSGAGAVESQLYSAAFSHRFRRADGVPS